jgi:hypothetical protein
MAFTVLPGSTSQSISSAVRRYSAVPSAVIVGASSTAPRPLVAAGKAAVLAAISSSISSAVMVPS